MAEKAIKKEKEKRYIFRKLFFLIVLFIAVLVLYSKYIGTKGIVVKEYRVESSVLPNTFSGIKIIHFADIFYGNTTDKTELDRISKTINELNPDLIVFTGNLYTREKKISKKDKEILIEFLSSLNSNLGKYASIGSSDYKLDYEKIISESNFLLLNNSYDLIYNNGVTPIFIAGVPAMSKEVMETDKVFEYYKDNSEENIKKAIYKIIISSEGNVFQNIMEYDNTVNLLLGSASLDGSVNIPFYGPLYIPKNSTKYYAPYYEFENTDIFISSGIGTDKIKFRFNNKPSINLYRLKFI